MAISDEDQGRQLRDLYVRLTTSPQVRPSYALWEELPELIRHAWAHVYRAVYENHPDKERMDWLEGELVREEKAIAAGTPICSIFRSNKPITREWVDWAMNGMVSKPK